MNASTASTQTAATLVPDRAPIRVSVVGASGYAGGELVRLLAQHPAVELVHLAAGQQAGKRLDQVFPSLGNLTGLAADRLRDRTLIATDWGQLAADSEAVFVSLPHGLSLPAVPKLLAGGTKVVDLGGDYRLSDPALFEQWYQLEHSAPDLLGEAVYGLPELLRSEISQSRLVANPGCYPTAATLALLPAAEAGLLGSAPVIVDAKSGSSGAGRSNDVAFSHAELNESMTAYKVFNHRHQPEMEQNLNFARRVAGQQSSSIVRFVPQLVPMTRGILATCYATLGPTSSDELEFIYRQRYADEPFVRVLGGGAMPSTKNVAGSNFAEVAVTFDPTSGLMVAVAAIDNLGKGAAGAALANFNLQWGLDESLGLGGIGVFP